MQDKDLQALNSGKPHALSPAWNVTGQLDGRPNLISQSRAVFSPPLPGLYAVRSIHPRAIDSWSVDMGLLASYTTCVRSVYSLGGGCYWLRRSLYSVGLYSPRAR